ncbi:MAG: ligase-associated DNA damage response endonuclease PdeM [Alphaproteobacteria bacterium]|nr:ligase-associated DNA damage response endonuclease PdeM [Alphaproteobacteria bacterium]
MRSAALALNGAKFVADLSGALYWPHQDTLIVADLHLEKGSRLAENGRFLPPYDTRATLKRLMAVLKHFRSRRVVCLGDSFDDDGAERRADDGDAATVQALTGAFDWIWIRGNHDPEPPRSWGGRCMDSWACDGLIFRHQAGNAHGEVSGHFHPKASMQVRSRRLTESCFIGDEARLILPAFGTYTGGLNVLEPAIARLFPGDFEAILLGRRRVHRCRRATLVR